MNVPMQLLFQPLVAGEVDEVRFQIVLCTGGPRLQNMIAVRGPRFTRDGREVQEIRYGPDLGKTVAFFASRLLPSFSFWFDARDGAYLGHRMPLHGNGPEVVLVRPGSRSGTSAWNSVTGGRGRRGASDGPFLRRRVVDH